MGAVVIHSAQAAPTQSDNRARSPTSQTPIARVADGDGGANTKAKERFGTHLPPSPACPRSRWDLGLGLGTWE